MSGSNASSRSKASPTNRSTTASGPAPTPRACQRIANTLDAAKFDAVVRKWLRRLPPPFTAAHRAAGYRYQLSILQAEFALTQVLDRPRTGRGFFEEVMRQNLDLGRPDQLQFRTRILNPLHRDER